jgi:hypothetical protein
MRHINNSPARKRDGRKGYKIDKRVVGVLFVPFFASGDGHFPVRVSGEAKGQPKAERGAARACVSR